MFFITVSYHKQTGKLLCISTNNIDSERVDINFGEDFYVLETYVNNIIIPIKDDLHSRASCPAHVPSTKQMYFASHHINEENYCMSKKCKFFSLHGRLTWLGSQNYFHGVLP